MTGRVWVAASLVLCACTGPRESVRVEYPQPPAGLQRIRMEGVVQALALGERDVWALVRRGNDTRLVRVDPRSGLPQARVDLPRRVRWTLDLGRRHVFVASAERRILLKFEPASLTIEQRLKMPIFDGFAVGFRSVWLTNTDRGSVSRVGMDGTQEVEIPVEGAHVITMGAGSVWHSTEYASPSVKRIDPATNRVVATFRQFTLADVGGGSVWMTSLSEPPNGRIRRLNPSTGRLADRFYPLDIAPATVAAGAGSVWLGRWFDLPGEDRRFIGGPFIGYWAVFRLDPRTMEPMEDPIPFPIGPGTPMYVGFDAVWSWSGSRLLRLGFDVADALN